MKKIKTSLSLESDRLKRLKHLARREHRSVSQLVNLILEKILPILEIDDTQFERLATALSKALHATSTPALPDITFPKPEGLGTTPATSVSSPKPKSRKQTTPSANPPTGSLPHSTLRVPSSALSTKAPAAPKPATRKATR